MAITVIVIPNDISSGRPHSAHCCAIDDATGAVLALYFRPPKILHGYTTLFHQLFTTHGLPVAVYGDRLNVFVRNDRHWTLEEELQGETFIAQSATYCPRYGNRLCRPPLRVGGSSAPNGHRH